MSAFLDTAAAHWHYWMCIALMMLGLYIVIAREYLVKKMMGLNMFQVAVIMFYVSMGKVKGGTAPIIPGYEPPDHGGHGEAAGEHGAAAAEHGAAAVEHGAAAAEHGAEAAAEHGTAAAEHGAEAALHGANAAIDVIEVLYSNPIPHVLMLTAIVVGVATTAVGLALAVRIHEAYGTVEEDEIVDMDSKQELLSR